MGVAEDMNELGGGVRSNQHTETAEDWRVSAAVTLHWLPARTRISLTFASA